MTDVTISKFEIDYCEINKLSDVEQYLLASLPEPYLTNYKQLNEHDKYVTDLIEFVTTLNDDNVDEVIREIDRYNEKLRRGEIKYAQLGFVFYNRFYFQRSNPTFEKVLSHVQLELPLLSPVHLMLKCSPLEKDMYDILCADDVDKFKTLKLSNPINTAAVYGAYDCFMHAMKKQRPDDSTFYCAIFGHNQKIIDELEQMNCGITGKCIEIAFFCHAWYLITYFNCAYEIDIGSICMSDAATMNPMLNLKRSSR